MTKIKALVALAASILAAATATAATTTYDEATFGDFGRPSRFLLTPGVTTFTGVAADSDIDEIYVTLGKLGVITGATLTADVTGVGGNYNFAPFTLVGGGRASGQFSEGSTDLAFVPFAPGGGLFKINSLARQSPTEIEYTLTLNVTEVPLPASGLLLLAGVAAVGGLRRRKQG